MIPRPAIAVALGVALLLGGAGCASTPEVSERTAELWDGTDAGLHDPAITFSVFQRAIRAGDLDTLTRVFAAGALDNLIADVAARGREEAAEWYRKDADRYVFTDPEWIKRSERLAYLRVRIVTRAQAAASEMLGGSPDGTRSAVFALGFVRGAWRITAFRSEADTEER